MRRSYSLLTLLFACPATFAQTPPSIEWQHALGGAGCDVGNALEQTNDGGYVMVGETYSNDGDITTIHSGASDCWVVKLASDGVLQWQKTLGGTGTEFAYSIHQTNDLGYIIAASSGSNDGDVTGNHGGDDCWVVKLDAAGNIQWQRSLGGSSPDGGRDVLQTPDNGYIVVGETASNNGDVTVNHGLFDVWLLKLDASGALIWQNTFGGSARDFGNAIVATSDGGYVLAGQAASNDGDVTGFQGGPYDYWFLKVDGSGQLEWQRTYGGSGDDEAHDIVRTSDGGFVAVGNCDSNDGNITASHGEQDCWMIGLDGNGNLQWQRSFGGSSMDFGESIIDTGKGAFVVNGGTMSNDGDVTMNHGDEEVWVIQVDTTGSLLWEKCYGGFHGEAPGRIVQTTDGGYAFAGTTLSNDWDVSGYHGGYGDVWVVKLEAEHAAVSELRDASAFNLWPNPASGELHISFNTRILTEVDLELYDNTGRSISSLSERPSVMERSLVVPTAQLAPGSYCIRIVADGMTTSRSFVKW